MKCTEVSGQIMFQQMKSYMALINSGKAKWSDFFTNEKDFQFQKLVVDETEKCVKRGGKETVSIIEFFVNNFLGLLC